MSSSPARISRRGLLGASAAVGAGAVAATAARTATAGPARAATTWVPPDAGLHLLRRATYGPTPAAVAAMAAQGGPTAWLERQLAPATIPDAACDAVVARYPRLRWPVWQQRHQGSAFGSWDAMEHLTAATIARAMLSERQLLEVMVDFWSNHLNVTSPSSEVWDCRAAYDEHVVRRHALGTFTDLLTAATLHPAMLRYLDNASSSAAAPNENHGRELLELHTVGLAAGYTEAHVRDSARVLTGLSVSGDSGEFLYKPWAHHVGPVSVLGWSHANASATGGLAVAKEYLRHLATHPATARHLATKLALRFVSDAPPARLVDALARAYLDGGTAIVPVLRVLFASPEFLASSGAKVKRPYEDLVSTLRILGYGADVSGTRGLDALRWMADVSGQRPLAWAPPNGYPDVAAAWQSTSGTLARWDNHLSLAGHWWPTELTQPPLRSLLPAALPATHGALVDAVSRRLTWSVMAPAHRAAALAFLEASETTPVSASSAAVTWRLPSLVALVLDSPYFSVR